MQVTFRTNPKTTGWARRAAIALLVGAGAMFLALPVAFVILLTHYRAVSPNDTQNMLHALTFGVVIGLAFAFLCASASLLLSVFLGFYKPANRAA